MKIQVNDSKTYHLKNKFKISKQKFYDFKTSNNIISLLLFLFYTSRIFLQYNKKYWFIPYIYISNYENLKTKNIDNIWHVDVN